MLSLKEISLSRGNKLLLEQAAVTLFAKQKIGLVGHNGCGKSSLFALILGQLTADLGEMQMHQGLQISHLTQQLPDSEQSALDFVLTGDQEYTQLQTQLLRAEMNQDHETTLQIHERLAQTGGYGKPAQAATIMAGLGFKASEQSASVNSFSGGWRMRLALARCLIQPAHLMLLDEPTNHLDMEAIFWLERFLKQSPATIITISHDREFLDAFCSHILHISQQKLMLYTGNYSRFEQTRAEQLALQQALYEKQQTQIKHMQSFVQRFKAKASKAKQAQSRVKAIERMELVAQAQFDSPFAFEFYPCSRAGSPLLNCQAVDAGYPNGPAILKKIQFAINPGDRLALLGPNGQGKSTFIKTLTGHLPPLAGEVHRHVNLKIGYYAQHQLEELDNRLSPLQTLQTLSPEAREQDLRNYLGGFDFRGDMAVNPIHYFSGGEKARLALAKLIWLKPNLLLLDEPTNHLDLEMRAAIEIALQSYEGALILISHDRHLLKSTVDEFYLVYDQQVKAFNGDLDDYHQWLLQKDKAVESKPMSEAASQRDKKPLQNRLKKVEQLMLEQQTKLQALEQELALDQIYESAAQAQLNALLAKQQSAQTSLEALETEWLELITSLES